ncbi:hypothetical protein E4198_12475 [Streptomyces sp. RKND-216]|uniref:DUF5819 family protein n=1 Tax=Streptomyces sp. RKND-216 TaxID=2562581 RepID=UPI00109E1D62|nr:DUF5819 family protein [Streptomyces sp. RKND-216]THA25423.1 hypothetical protein E4198_12475 [Streptomyces sp. RKND-216]
MEPEEEQRGGLAALSWPGRVVVATAVAVVAVAVTVHLAMVFLHVAPANTLSKQQDATIDAYVYPEFEQNWKLFAPNPLQQNIAVQARARVVDERDGTRTTGWIDLSAEDGAHIRGNLFPSHTAQNELRRAWDFYTGSHDAENRPDGMRGDLSQTYVERIVMDRFTERFDGTVDSIQLRSATTRVPAPAWSDERFDTDTEYRVLPWWDVSEAAHAERKAAS